MSNLTIPQCRERLTTIANDLEDCKLPATAAEIREIVEQMKRRPAVRKAKPRSVKMTPELRAEIANFARNAEDHTYQDIAEIYGVSAGRVSEAVAGFRQ